MMDVLGRPVLEHILRLLKKNGVDEACLTLRWMPESITDYFGDGGKLGMRLVYRTEREPLGTAGGVRACADFIGGEDFLVISGDGICDFDLAGCVRRHRESGAEATILLHPESEPLEYGLAVTDAGGRVARFVEKPGWESVVTDMANTGVYILSNSVLGLIPEGRGCDFGADVFPEMIERGRALFGLRADGYWCDIGSASAYRRCCLDALEGRVRLDIPAPEVREGIFSLSEIPRSALVRAPAYIGENVHIGDGASISHSVIGSGSAVGDGAEIRDSVLIHAAVGPNASAVGAVLDEGAGLGESAEAFCGSVLGAGSHTGYGASVMEGACLRAGERLPGGAEKRGRCSFSLRGGRVRTCAGPEELLRLGSLAAGPGRIAVSCGADGRERALLSAFESGARLAGADVLVTDAAFEAEAAFAAELFGVRSVFLRLDGDGAELSFFGPDGLPPERAELRKLAARQDGRETACGAGEASALSGVREAYVFSAGPACGEGTAVSGRGEENRTLARALGAAGPSAGAPGARLVFTAQPGGFALTLRDEQGENADAGTVAMLLAEIAFRGGAPAVAAEFGAPDALEELAARHGARILRIGRDGGARRLLSEQRFMRDAVSAAAELCRYGSRESIAALRAALPRVFTAEREVEVPSRAPAMRALRESCCEMSAELFGGMRLREARGAALVTPLQDAERIRIRAECTAEEKAEELAADIASRIKSAPYRL